MTFRNRLAATLVISFLLSAPAIVKSQVPKKPPTKSAPTQKKPTMPLVAGTAVFAVQKYEDGVSIDPIVIFNKGQYIDPQPDQTSAVSKQVVAKYMRAGQKHRLIFGGAEAGTITIKEAPTESQIGLTTSATLQSSIKIGGAVMALATTFAGNLTILGSVANIIVVESARGARPGRSNPCVASARNR